MDTGTHLCGCPPAVDWSLVHLFPLFLFSSSTISFPSFFHISHHVLHLLFHPILNHTCSQCLQSSLSKQIREQVWLAQPQTGNKCFEIHFSEKNVSRSQGGETTPPSPLLTHSIIYQFKNKDFYVLLSVLPSILSSYYSHMLTLSHSTSHFSQCKTSVCLAKTKVLWISVGDFSPVCLFVFVCFYLFHHIDWIFFESVHV